jgi:hypothetical protein
MNPYPKYLIKIDWIVEYVLDRARGFDLIFHKKWFANTYLQLIAVGCPAVK